MRWYRPGGGFGEHDDLSGAGEWGSLHIINEERAMDGEKLGELL